VFKPQYYPIYIGCMIALRQMDYEEENSRKGLIKAEQMRT
jgi:hypothetical protein